MRPWFATVTDLLTWSDYDLEQEGQLTHPMRYDRDSDRYVACEWDEAFRAINSQLNIFDPKSVIFYSSGRASLETSYLYALFARVYGNNNLPDSSNMCHETTSVALKKVIGAGVGALRPGMDADVTVLTKRTGRYVLRDNEKTEVVADSEICTKTMITSVMFAGTFALFTYSMLVDKQRTRNMRVSTLAFSCGFGIYEHVGYCAKW